MLRKAHQRLLLLIALSASLSGSFLLTGCASASWFERFYKPAPASAYAPSEAIPKVPICGPIRQALIGSESAEMLPTAVPGLFSDFLAISGATKVSANPAATPQLVWSSDPDGDGKRLAQEGYALIGTSSFWGWGGFFSHTQQGLGQATEESTAQGKKVGAAVVLLRVPYTTVCAVGAGGASNPLELHVLRADQVAGPRANTIVFASYWTKANAP